MIRYRVLQFLFLVGSITSQVIGMIPQEITRPSEEVSSMPFQVEGIAQKIEELPKELQYKIFPLALALRENPKYEVYKRFTVDSRVTGIVLNEDNTRALTGSWDGVARLWDVEKGIILKELKAHTEPISSVALSTDGTLVLTGSHDKTVRVWNMNTEELIRVIEIGSPVRSVVLSTNGALALISSTDRIARLYNTSTRELKELTTGHEVGIFSVALSADGTLALTGSEDGTVRIWDTNTGELTKTIQVGSRVNSVALSADGTIALTGTGQSKVLVWDVNSGALLNTLLQTDSDWSVALSKDGKRALVTTLNDTIYVWNTQPLPGKKETSTPLTVLESHTDLIKTVAFGGADFIASSSYDKTALIWKPFALEPQDPQDIAYEAYKETFSRPILRSGDGN